MKILILTFLTLAVLLQSGCVVARINQRAAKLDDDEIRNNDVSLFGTLPQTMVEVIAVQKGTGGDFLEMPIPGTPKIFRASLMWQDLKWEEADGSEPDDKAEPDDVLHIGALIGKVQGANYSKINKYWPRHKIWKNWETDSLYIGVSSQEGDSSK